MSSESYKKMWNLGIVELKKLLKNHFHLHFFPFSAFFQLNTSTSQQLNILVFPYSHGAEIRHGRLSWKYRDE